MQHAPDWTNRLVAIVSGLILAGITLWMSYMLCIGTLEVRSDNVETTVLGWPVWIFMPFAVVSCVLWAIATLIDVISPMETENGA